MNMPLLNLIIQPLLGAAAGYITNEYAINMLFKTYTPLKLGGVIPKTREAFIENVSTLVEEDIINKEKVEKILNDEAFTKNFDALIQDFFTKSIYEVTDNLSVGDNPFTDKVLSDAEKFINEQIRLKLPELIHLLAEQVKLCDVLDKTQINVAVEKLYSYLLNILKDTQISDKLVLNVLNNNENTSLMDIVGYDASAIISQNISDLLVENLAYVKKSNNNFYDINSLVNEMFEKANISSLLFEFSEKFINENENKLRDRMLSIFDSITTSDEFNKTSLEFSEKLLEYAKNLDMPLLSLVDKSCINNFRDILYKESSDLSNLLISFVNSNKAELQNMIEEALNETINEQDTAKKAVLSMAKGSILNSIAKNDISDLSSEYFQNSNNRLNLCTLASAKLKEYLNSTTISQAIDILEKKEILSAKALSEFLLTYISSNGENIINRMFAFIKEQITNEAFKKDIILKLRNTFIEKIVLSSRTKDFLNSQLSIYLTRLFDTKFKDIIKADFNNNSNITDKLAYENLSQDNFSFNDYIYNYLEQNKEKIVEALSSNISNATQDKNINDILNYDLSDKINTSSCNFAYGKVNEIKEKISEEKTYDLYDKLNNIDNLHKNSSKLLKDGVINNLGSLLHRFVKGLSFKNLSQLDDDNLIEMAQSFIGNNLKPIMIFGAMLGLMAGFILAFLQPNNNVFALVSISGIVTCALVGYLTNAIAIAMLFRPYKEIKILRYIPFFRHFSLGYIAKNKENLADGMSQSISEYLLTKESMNELIDTYKDSIKDSIIYNASKNNYELISNSFMSNKDKIASSICDYAIEALSTNKDNISTAIAKELENIKLNDLLQNEDSSFENNDIKKSSFEGKISEYIINSKLYFNELILKHLLEMGKINPTKSEFMSPRSIASILPQSITANINRLVANASYKGYDELIGKINYENIKNFAKNHDEDYQKFISRSLSEIFSKKDLLSIHNSPQITNDFFKPINKALNSQEKIGEIFNKKISVISNNLLYSFFENLGLNSDKLLKPMQANISKAVKEKITSKLNLLTKISYGMMGGDKLVDSMVEKILSDKLPKLISSKKSSLYESCFNYLNNKFLNLSLAEFGISLNSDIIASAELCNINGVISPAIDFIDKKMACIKVKTLLEPLSLDNMDIIFSSYDKEISALIETLSSKLMKNKDDILSSFNLFIGKYLNDTMKNTSINIIFKNISAEDFKNISDSITNILFEERLVEKNVYITLNCIKNYDRQLCMSEIISKDEFIEKFEKLVDNLSGNRNLADDKISANNEIANTSYLHDSAKLVFIRTIDDILSQASKNGFAFINNESKEYLLIKTSDAVILSLRNNLSSMLNDIEFDKIAREQIIETSPKKIHMMFNSFAGKYFRTLILYGFWGAVFGINTILGLVLATAYGVKSIVKKP